MPVVGLDYAACFLVALVFWAVCQWLDVARLVGLSSVCGSGGE